MGMMGARRLRAVVVLVVAVGRWVVVGIVVAVGIGVALDIVAELGTGVVVGTAAVLAGAGCKLAPLNTALPDYIVLLSRC